MRDAHDRSKPRGKSIDQRMKKVAARTSPKRIAHRMEKVAARTPRSRIVNMPAKPRRSR